MTDSNNAKKSEAQSAPSTKRTPAAARRDAGRGTDARDRRDAGGPRPGSLADRSRRVGKAIAGIRTLRLPEPRQVEIHAEFDEVRLTGLEMKGLPMLGMTLFEVTGAGKTTTAEEYAKRINAADADGQVSVLHIRLDSSGTARSLYVEALAKLGDGFALSGTEHSLRRRTLEALADAGTQLVIIDESHHGGKRSGFGGEITASVKLLLDGGVVPVALLGTEEAVPIFAKDLELSGRLTAPCSLNGLRWHDDYEREVWGGLLTNLDMRLVSDGILARKIGLDDPELERPLIEATNGVIGQLMGTIRTAVRTAIRDGRDHVTREDLVSAIDLWNVGHRFIDHNPLRHG
jgi:hypothetical protein